MTSSHVLRWGRVVSALRLGIFWFLAPGAAPAAGAVPAIDQYSGFQIGRIYIQRRDIFDTSVPSENKRLYRTINALHFSTHEKTIHEQLLFKEGDPYLPDLARESERAIRRILALRDVNIIPVPIGRQRVDVVVETQETWSTQPSVGVSGAGADLKTRFGLRERNFLGLGKDINLVYKKDSQHITRAIGYDDPAFWGTHWTLGGTYEDLDGGSSRSLRLERPFFSSITPFAIRGTGAYEQKEIPFYLNGEEIRKYREENRRLGVGTAFSIGSTPQRVRRLGLDYGYRHDKQFEFLTTPTLLSDKVYHSVGPSMEWTNQDFITVDHVRLFDREEDYNLGWAFHGSVGLARSRWFRESQNATFVNTGFSRGGRWGPGRFSLAKLTTEARKEKRWENAASKIDLEYNNHFSPRQTLTTYLGWNQILRPEVGDQLLLGGDNGLRGYPVNHFAGNRVFRGTVENRIFLFPDLFKVVGVGAVVFADTGYAWARGRSVRWKDLRGDAGVGLRFHISRASLGHVIRLDLATPLRPVEGEPYWLFTFGTGQVF